MLNGKSSRHPAGYVIDSVLIGQKYGRIQPPASY